MCIRDRGYTLNGNGITVENSITATNLLGANTVALGYITLGRDLPFTVAQNAASMIISSEVRLNGNDLTANSIGSLVLNGVITGTGHLLSLIHISEPTRL